MAIIIHYDNNFVFHVDLLQRTLVEGELELMDHWVFLWCTTMK